jgi:prepilin-type processing-associated H-X9-DG protein
MRIAATRIELVLATSLTVLVAGLVLPRVQAARADAARAQCTENLRKLGQGLQEYAKNNGGFPARRTNTVKGGWGPYVLPYIGEEALAKKYSFKHDCFDPANKAVVETKVKTFLCPSSPANRVLAIEAQASGKSENPDKDTLYHVDGGVNDYITSNGLLFPGQGYGLNANLVEQMLSNQRQAMTDEVTLPLTKISDGLSCTLLLIEQAGRPQSWRNGKRTDQGDLFGMAANARGMWAGYGSIAFGPANRADGNTPGVGDNTDCSVNCNNQFGIYGFHTGGANVLMCDGSVKFVGEKLTPITFALLSLRDDGQVIGPNDY